jgi:hypothetical protein
MARPPEVVEEFGYTKQLVTRNRTMPSAVVDAENMSMHGSDFRRKNGGGRLGFSSTVISTRISKSDISSGVRHSDRGLSSRASLIERSAGTRVLRMPAPGSGEAPF